MAGFDSFQPMMPGLPPPPVAIFPIFEVSRQPDIWPLPSAPEPDLLKRGLTEARCVIQYFYGRTTDERLDALKHLANISTLKAANRAYWSPKPYLKFVGTNTARRDWENCDPHHPVFQKITTRGWFTTHLPEHIDKYSPRHITRRELVELARMRDKDLLHVCHALVFDLLNESAKQERNEISFSTLRGQELFFDEKSETAVQATESATISGSAAKPDYSEAVAMLVRDQHLRAALPRTVCRTLELLFRKLAYSVDACDVISEVAREIGRDERTVRRHLAAARTIATDSGSPSNGVLRILASLVLPGDRDRL